MGILQEEIYRSYGKHPEELMFLIHFYSLPFFIFIGPSIYETAVKFHANPHISIVNHDLPISMPWLTLIGMCFLQLICIKNVYQLSAVLSSLGISMVLTLRKFLNLFLSVYIFQNEFTSMHLLGTLCVLLGTFAFYDGFSKLANLFKHKKVD
uniref:Uncharacterized protein n=1 Tax=Acrobeloides nanus TaxID=290746 RepID=A0A914CEP7_9BILA